MKLVRKDSFTPFVFILQISFSCCQPLPIYVHLLQYPPPIALASDGGNGDPWLPNVCWPLVVRVRVTTQSTIGGQVSPHNRRGA